MKGMHTDMVKTIESIVKAIEYETKLISDLKVKVDVLLKSSHENLESVKEIQQSSSSVKSMLGNIENEVRKFKM